MYVYKVITITVWWHFIHIYCTCVYMNSTWLYQLYLYIHIHVHVHVGYQCYCLKKFRCTCTCTCMYKWYHMYAHSCTIYILHYLNLSISWLCLSCSWSISTCTDSNCWVRIWIFVNNFSCSSSISLLDSSKLYHK